MALSLPKNPTGEQFEDLLSASLRANGYFTESRVTLRRKKNEVLEIDVLATPVGGGDTAAKLFEAKRKKRTDLYGTIFKLYGQRMYVGIESACLVCPDPVRPEHASVCESLKAETKVEVCHHGLPDSSLDSAAPIVSGLDERERRLLAACGWYANIARRLAQDTFVREMSKHDSDEPYASARTYFRRVQQSVFVRGSLARVAHLYGAYQASTNLSGQFVTSLVAEQGVRGEVIWTKLHDTSELLWLQFMEAIEHSARLAVLKNAVQHIVSSGSPKVDTYTLSFGGVEVHVPRHDLPARFSEGMRDLFAEPWGLRVPYCLQLFIEGFGGVLSLTDDTRDVEFLAKASGIPVKSIPAALAFYDRIFGNEHWSWFQTSADIRLVKMIPAFMHGTGAFLRKMLFDLKDYSDSTPRMGWLFSKWHNAAYSILSPALEAPPSPGSATARGGPR